MRDNRELTECLDALRGSKVVILGVGHILKGDDGVGPLICEHLKGSVSATVIDAGTVPENYVRPIVRATPEKLLIIDAVDFGDRPGTVRVCRPDEIADFAFSTHALSLHLFVEMLHNDIPVEVFLLGIQPGEVRLGESASPAVWESVQRLTGLLRDLFPPIA
jgi:hydrogenase maturation protease HycI